MNNPNNRPKNKQKSTIAIVLAFISGIAFLAVSDTAVFAKKTKMSPDHADFISKVRYIISKDEAAIFKSLPEEKRDEFIKTFWEVRDPNTATLENEFKDEYYRRIDEANRLFRCGKEGWLTDRGKTFILLGPPLYISDRPTGDYASNPYTRPYVVWSYGEFSILFVDEKNDGDYQVDYVNNQHLALVQEAFVKAKQELKAIGNIFNYDFTYSDTENPASLIFTMNLDQITFKTDNEKMVSKMEIDIKVKDKEYKDVWTYNRPHTVEFSKDGTTSLPKKIEIRIPLDIQKKGTFFFYTSIIKMDDREKDKAFMNKTIKIK